MTYKTVQYGSASLGLLAKPPISAINIGGAAGLLDSSGLDRYISYNARKESAGVNERRGSYEILKAGFLRGFGWSVGGA